MAVFVAFLHAFCGSLYRFIRTLYCACFPRTLTLRVLMSRFQYSHILYRFEKNDILRIVRALAIFRPSLIAMQMPLTEEDEVFVEKCFQRSIIVRPCTSYIPTRLLTVVLHFQELDKLISYSGTPTVVWRRTGEICLVGPEFCMLTEWTKEELLGKGKYIWEVRDLFLFERI